MKPRARARAQAEAQARLRTSGHNCPLCLQTLPRIAGGRVSRLCRACGARAVPDKRCSRCHGDSLWEVEARAACQACGNNGSRVKVVAGDLARTLDS